MEGIQTLVEWVSLEQQLGRVNFIENVRSGGNLMNNRTSFDQFEEYFHWQTGKSLIGFNG